MPSARELIEEHIAAFNAHDTARLLARLAPDVVWATGRDVIRGRDELAEVFDDGLWQLRPSLVTRRLVASGNVVAVELSERLHVDGVARLFPIAAFFDVSGGVIRSARVYREGSADIDP
ncbi:MAG TPA: nuclear transport factor 2 family protein [Jatrophihabitantaceae bacterium]|jgi:hypothetical protein